VLVNVPITKRDKIRASIIKNVLISLVGIEE
jgi:hypothetical protein